MLAFLLAVPLGMLLAIARVYGGAAAARIAARVYIEVFRGTPVLLQLFVLYYGLAPYINLGPMQAAILGLGLNYAAYEAEVYRGALLAIPRGQSEAARALGLAPWQTLRHVLMPQALRLALPPMTNDFVSLLKDSLAGQRDHGDRADQAHDDRGRRPARLADPGPRVRRALPRR